MARAARLIQATGRTLFTEPITARLAKANATPFAPTHSNWRAKWIYFWCSVATTHACSGSPATYRWRRHAHARHQHRRARFSPAVPSDQIEKALKQIWRGGFKFERRALIEAATRVNGKPIRKLALNDIVIGRGEVARLD